MTASAITHTPTSASPPYEFPGIYSFPPFYTLQPNLTTRAAQLSSWSAILLSYASSHRLYRIHASHPIFTNVTLKRSLAPSDARILLAHMVSSSLADSIDFLSVLTSAAAITAHAQAEGKKKGKVKEEEGEVWLWWHTPEEWAGLLVAWVEKTGQRGSVLTFYELVEGEATEGEPFWGLPREMLGKVVGVLVRRGKAVVLGEGDGLGVKVW